jgi:hypothetical protein
LRGSKPSTDWDIVLPRNSGFPRRLTMHAAAPRFPFLRTPAGTAAVLGDELDSSLFERRLDVDQRQLPRKSEWWLSNLLFGAGLCLFSDASSKCASHALMLKRERHFTDAELV